MQGVYNKALKYGQIIAKQSCRENIRNLRLYAEVREQCYKNMHPWKMQGICNKSGKIVTKTSGPVLQMAD